MRRHYHRPGSDESKNVPVTIYDLEMNNDDAESAEFVGGASKANKILKKYNPHSRCQVEYALGLRCRQWAVNFNSGWISKLGIVVTLGPFGSAATTVSSFILGT